MARFRQVEDSEWYEVNKKGDKEGCCDCGLVHNIEYKIVAGPDGSQTLFMRASRNNRATAQVRRSMKKKGLLK